MRKYLLVVFLLSFTVTVLGATRTWNGIGVTGGTGSANFNLASNWSGGVAPGPTDDAIITWTANNNNSIVLSANITISSLTINDNTSPNNPRTHSLNVGAFSLSVTTLTVTNDASGNGPVANTILIAAGGTLAISGNSIFRNNDSGFGDNSVNIINNGTVNFLGTVLAYSLNSVTFAQVTFQVASGAVTTFNGAVVFDDATSYDDGFYINDIVLQGTTSASTGKFVFNSNVTFGENSGTINYATSVDFSSGTFEFNGTSTQAITDRTFNYFIIPRHITTGASNSPTISIGTNFYSFPGIFLSGDLTIRNNSSLTVASIQTLNTNAFRLATAATGTMRLSNTATLNVPGVSLGIGASNFPAGFATYTIDSTTTVNFSGAAQTIPGTAQLTGSLGYGNLTTSGSGVKSLGSDINVFRNLTIGSGTNFTPGASTVALKSNSVTTANLAAVAGTITDATGQFSIERYLPSQVAWRLLAAPIRTGTSPSVFTAYQEGTTATTSTGFGTQITGVGSGNGFDLQTPSYSMKYFNPGTQNYTPITNTSTAIANPAGHYIFVRGDKSIAPGGGGFTTLRMKGQVFTGTQVVNVPAGGFASFGNPYPSRIDMRTTTKSASLVDGFTVWNPGSPGSFNVGGYEAYTLQSGQYRNSAGTVIRNFIESGEAVFIQTAPASPAGTLTINESDKGNGSSVVSREGTIGGNDARFVLALSRLDAANVPTYKSAVLINPDAAYSNGLDNNDVRKFNNSSDNLSMSIAAANLEVNRRNVFTAADTIFLKLTSTAVANYMFDAFAENIDAPGLTAYLQDKFTNTTTLISLNDSTHIPFSISAVAGSNASDRFSIVFKEVQVLPISYTSITAVRNADKTATVNWAVATETGVQNYGIEHSTDGITFMKIGEQAANNTGLDATYSFIHATASSGENFYRIRSKEVAGDSKLSNIAKLSATQELNNSLLSVFPNPVSNGVMNVTLAAAAGKYQITLYDNAGKQVLQKSGLVAARNSIDVAGLSAGIYTLVATDGKEKYSLKVSIQ